MRPLIISAVKTTAFTRPLLRPFPVAGQPMTERSGFYVELTAESGLTAQGEAAPLPGMSAESLKKAGHDLALVEALIKGVEFPSEMLRLTGELRENKALAGLCPSVRFAVESALFTLACQLHDLELSVFLGGSARPVEHAVLLQGSYDQVMAEAKQRRSVGARVFKLKVGDRNVALDVKKVNDVRSAIGPEGRLRLDANGAWNFSEAVLFAQLAGTQQIEFIEEPVSDMGRSAEFYQTTGMPVALDESLQVMRCGVTAPGRCQPTMASSDAVAAYVLKPMVIGGIVKTLDWMEEARRLGKKVIISSALETPVGMAVLEALAALTSEPAGLDTNKWLA